MSSGGLYRPDGEPTRPAATLGGRTWLEAATALPATLPRRYQPAEEYGDPGAGRCVVIPYLRPALDATDRPAYARVYRTGQDPDDPELGPCWHWRCSDCGMQSNGCYHTVLHEVGSWRAVMCGGFHHVHTEHPRRPAVQGEHPHDTLNGRRRCDWTMPTEEQRAFASYVLCGHTGYPRGERAREMAREVLALAGIRTP